MGVDAKLSEAPRVNWKRRLKSLGWAGFFVFLLKGIIWLVVGYLLIQ
jgi:hypothetical protein